MTSVGSEVLIATEWDRAADHIPRTTEDDWLQYLRDHGVPVDTLAPKDNRVFGRISLPDAVHPKERYRVRVWLQDDRLTTDARLADPAWLAANPVRYHDGPRAVVYEFPLLTSLFRDFASLVRSYPGNYVELPVSAAASRALLLALATHAAGAVASFPSSLDNTRASELGRFLRHVFAPRGPEGVGDGERDAWLRRAPGYHDKPERMTDAQRAAVTASWADALGAYDAIEQQLGLETARGPLPDRLELHALQQGGDTIGWLIEAPEAIDFTRLATRTRPVPGGWRDALVVPNRDNTRAFVFRSGGSEVAVWAAGTHALRFVFHRTVGTRYAPLRHIDGGDTETAVIVVTLPADRFTPEVP